MTTSLFAPLTLPNGGTLPNRIAKAAMEENLADAGQLPGAALWRLYEAWGAGGAGLLITGNVMIDGRALTGPGGVVPERGTPLEPFRRSADGRTLAREAYFLSFAQEIAAVSRMPVMTTGGIRRQAVAVVAMASALACMPDLPKRWRDGQAVDAPLAVVGWRDKAVAGLATMALVKRRLRVIAAGRRPRRSYSPLYSLVIDQLRTCKLTARYRQWRQARG
ncbi:hypothetical protein [Paraburkholderia sacchari]|uniref:hypothetical protein n=1 Tax=Paraburkholderia sacchari TaxID=159450 RepID=UPI00054314F6|nr:hypothetical protein [Paraburkholderia sacchari]NLP62908.1 hypothetical protein [Paraburkholderia sacchari]